MSLADRYRWLLINIERTAGEKIPGIPMKLHSKTEETKEDPSDSYEFVVRTKVCPKNVADLTEEEAMKCLTAELFFVCVKCDNSKETMSSLVDVYRHWVSHHSSSKKEKESHQPAESDFFSSQCRVFKKLGNEKPDWVSISKVLPEYVAKFVSTKEDQQVSIVASNEKSHPKSSDILVTKRKAEKDKTEHVPSKKKKPEPKKEKEKTITVDEIRIETDDEESTKKVSDKKKKEKKRSSSSTPNQANLSFYRCFQEDMDSKQGFMENERQMEEFATLTRSICSVDLDSCTEQTKKVVLLSNLQRCLIELLQTFSFSDCHRLVKHVNAVLKSKHLPTIRLPSIYKKSFDLDKMDQEI